MTGLLIGMRAYVNCVCLLLRFFVKIRKYFCFYFYLSSFFRKLLLLFTQVNCFTKYFYFYSSSFESNFFYFYSSTKKSYSSILLGENRFHCAIWQRDMIVVINIRINIDLGRLSISVCVNITGCNAIGLHTQLK